MATDDVLRERIHENVIKCGCWVWTRSSLPSGYGRISIGAQKQDYVHRVSYRVFKGAIPDGMLIMHSCDNPRCCNPDHLSAGTQFDNMQDCSRKQRVRVFIRESSAGESNGRAKLKECDVLEIRRMHTLTPLAELAHLYGVSRATLDLVRKGKTWRHLLVEKEGGPATIQQRTGVV